jgi:hypothetical protein
LKVLLICLLCVLSAFAQRSAAQSATPSVPEANPGRPTVSTPATLTPVGYLQFENGALFAEKSTEFSKRTGIGQVTKLSVLPRLELFLQSEPLAISQSESQTAVHEGEVFAGVQSVLFVGDESRPTVSISYVRRVHTSVAPELDVGTFRQSTSAEHQGFPQSAQSNFLIRANSEIFAVISVNLLRIDCPAIRRS